MRYIVDIEALNNCLELTPKYIINGKPYVALETVKEMIDKFPKEEMREFIETLERFNIIKT